MARVGSSVALIAAFGCMLAGCTVSFGDSGKYNASTKFHRSLPAAGVHSIRVSNVSGKIDVLGSRRADVEVDAVIRAPDKAALQRITVSADRTDDSVRIRTQYPTTLFSFGGRTEGRVDYEIRVPGSIAVTVSDVDGDVTVSGVDGDIGAASISGDISASTGSGNLNLKTTSGAAAGTAHTVTASSQLSVGSVSGDVSLRIPRHAGANITARSVSGDFSSNLGLPKSNATVGTNVSATLNGGGAKISFATVSGAMTLTGF